MKRSKYLILIILIGFSSCALKKEYVIGDSKRLTAKKIVKIINENENDIKTFQARARIDYFRKKCINIITKSKSFEITFPKGLTTIMKILRVLPYWKYLYLIEKLTKLQKR